MVADPCCEQDHLVRHDCSIVSMTKELNRIMNNRKTRQTLWRKTIHDVLKSAKSKRYMEIYAIVSKAASRMDELHDMDAIRVNAMHREFLRPLRKIEKMNLYRKYSIQDFDDTDDMEADPSDDETSELESEDDDHASTISKQDVSTDDEIVMASDDDGYASTLSLRASDDGYATTIKYSTEASPAFD